MDNSIVTFVPSPASDTTTADYDRELLTNRISDPDPGDSIADNAEDLLSAVQMKPSSKKSRTKSFRTGYHASTGPTDFLKKKYKSQYLEVEHCQKIWNIF